MRGIFLEKPVKKPVYQFRDVSLKDNAKQYDARKPAILFKGVAQENSVEYFAKTVHVI